MKSENLQAIRERFEHGWLDDTDWYERDVPVLLNEIERLRNALERLCDEYADRRGAFAHSWDFDAAGEAIREARQVLDGER